MMNHLRDIRDLVGAMKEHRIAHLKSSAWGIEIELDPSAFAALATAAEPMRIEPEGLCKCGHDLASEHSESGCLRGCALEACVPGEGEEP